MSSTETRTDSDRREGGWLCPTAADRARLADMSPAVARAWRRVLATATVGVLAMEPWIGIVPVIVLALVAGPLLLMDRWMARLARPERLAAGVLLWTFLLILASAAVSGGAHSPILPWVAGPVMVASARFRPRAFYAAAAVTAGITLAVLLIVSGHDLRHNPTPLFSLGVLLGGLVFLQEPILDAEHRWREDAVLDSLTGLLNRQGLDRRFVELAQQARQLEVPMSLVLFDIDRFKSVNDTHGHARGDDVLTGVADVLRRQLRSFELLYRLGGDELLLLLPGTDRDDARHVAEQARMAVQLGRPADLDVTVSIGVCSARGREIALLDMYAAADRSLYEAKRGGRNTVCDSAVDAPVAAA